MYENRPHPLHALALFVSLTLLVVAGCWNDDGFEKRYPVSGTVTYHGEPVAKGSINFVPVDKGGATHGSSGSVESGWYSLTTLNPGDGALPGEYKVIIDARQINEDELKAEAAKLAAQHGMEKSTRPPPSLVAKYMKKAATAIPAKYQRLETTDLTAQVEAQTNHFNFELKD